MSLSAFLDKINYGYDGVLYEVHFTNDLRDIKLTTFVKDEIGNRIVLDIFLSDIKECKLSQVNGNNFSWLTNGIKYKEMGGLHCLTITVNDEVDEIEIIDIFKNTEVYFIASNLTYQVTPYDEKMWPLIFKSKN
ncbi:hypothetical protein [Bartonella sp. HY038]|uniref:hypothetical protein n=1 Tax=Bartonella sp. HY038 TaxID=2759660 RepID=UPI0015FC5418|nr:hypothetical protein [Bartonella sp. HY038]